MVQSEATISKVTSMRDGSLRLQVDTQELTPNTMANVMMMYNKFGTFAFSETEIKPEEVKVPEYAKVEKNDKTPSQRLRSVIFKVWDTNGRVEGDGNFDNFYRQKMEQIINHLKNQINSTF
jgi:hypothetical protein